jgi:threonine dehydrogenase-like Zn-dependent dehydrogenase
MESHGFSMDNMMDYVEQTLKLETDRPAALRHAIYACRKGGRVSVPGVYGGFVDKFPLGPLMEKGLTVRSGQTHVQKYMPQLLDMIREGRIDTTFLISHHLPLNEADEGYRMFSEEQNSTTKVVLKC